MIKKLMFGVLLALGSSTSAQERRFEIPSFTAIQSIASDDVLIEPGNAISVVATGDPRAVATLSIYVEEGVLHLGRTPGTHTDGGALITVTTPSLRAIRLSGSGTIRMFSNAGRRFDAILDGSGNLLLPRVNVLEVRLELNGSGHILAAGNAQTETISLGGSGSVDARQLSTQDLSVALGGSGNVDARATRVARIAADGSGKVNIAGHPLCRFSDTGPVNVTCH